MKWLVRWYNRRRRAIDIDSLWVSICKNSFNHEQAVRAMMRHAMTDDAWSDLTDGEKASIIAGLEYRQ